MVHKWLIRKVSKHQKEWKFPNPIALISRLIKMCSSWFLNTNMNVMDWRKLNNSAPDYALSALLVKNEFIPGTILRALTHRFPESTGKLYIYLELVWIHGLTE